MSKREGELPSICVNSLNLCEVPFHFISRPVHIKGLDHVGKCISTGVTLIHSIPISEAQVPLCKLHLMALANERSVVMARAHILTEGASCIVVSAQDHIDADFTIII